MITKEPHSPAGAALTELVLEVFRVNGALLAAGDRLARGLGLTSARWQVLGALAGKPLTAAQLARNMGLKRQSVQRLVDVLHGAGMLAFEENPDHLRAKLIGLTDLGRRKYEEIGAIQARWANRIGLRIEPETLQAATVVLRELRGRLRQHRGIDGAG